MEKVFDYSVSEKAFTKEFNEIASLGMQIGSLLDNVGLNTCVIAKKRWISQIDGSVHETWGVHTCNSVLEEETTITEELL